MEEKLINFETAKIAKEKGFHVDKYYNNYRHGINYYENEELLQKGHECSGSASMFEDIYDAPTQSVLQKWLREKHSLYIFITANVFVNNELFDSPDIDINYTKPDKFYFHINGNKDNHTYSTFEEALEAALKKGLKLI